MLKNPQSVHRLKFFIAIILTPILLLGFFVGAVEAEWAGHLVISAVQITEGEGKTNHDFVEIYNPTASDINLKGYRLVKRTKIGISDTNIKSWTEDAVVKAHSWRLWVSSDDEAWALGNSADDRTTATVSPDNGIAIRLGALDTGEIIDAVAWGAAENIFKEGVAAPAPGAGEVLIRKSGASSGSGEDTNNNAGDFNMAANFVPRNGQSAAAPATENSSLPILTPNPNLNPEPSSSPVAGIVSVQLILPVAEAGSDKEAILGENLDFDGSDSFDPTGKKLEFSWDFGDKTSGKGENASHIYRAIGDYAVVLKVSNGEGANEDTLKVKIIAPEFSDKIILSEILPNPIGVDKDGEWIELFNSGDKKINLKGWILATGAKTVGKQYVFAGDKSIEAKNHLIIKRSESELALTNENGKVKLIWSPEKIVSEVSYGAAKDGKSYAFIGSAWQWVDTPTPGKVNSAKAIVTTVSKNKENNAVSAISAGILKNTDNPETAIKESETGGSAPIKSLITKNTVFQSLADINIEDFLDQLIVEKVDNAIRKAMTSEVLSENKILALTDTQSVKSAELDKKLATVDIGAEDKSFTANSQNDIRNNPWFYGDLILSALCLFLVWRYQEVRKNIKI